VSGDRLQEEVERQLGVMARGAEAFHGKDELRSRLGSALREKRPLRVKLGMDPSAPDLHLGHTIVLRKLKLFQDLGHTPIFLVGDFTARIGDPSGRKKTRPALDSEAVRANARTYVDQVGRILDVGRAEIRFNGEWMDQVGAADLIRLCSRATVAQLLAREDFSRRHSAGEPIALHEFIYPLVQAYDSVALQADVELGGTDQTFNLLMGREIQRAYGQPPQAVITHPLLVGTDGREKMSKSLGNLIGIMDPPEEMYGKVMSLPDSAMGDWYRILQITADDLVQGAWIPPDGDPFGLKQQLAASIVGRFHGRNAAVAAADHFRRVVQRKEAPDEIPEVALVAGAAGVTVIAALVQAGLAKTNSEARRLVTEGAVWLNEERVSDPSSKLGIGRPYLLRAGKRRFARIRVT
jgi:tyrosyl-tRNA synthetase